MPSNGERLLWVATKLDSRQADGIIQMTPRAAKFVAEVVERGQKDFSEKQAEWLASLEEEYLG